MKTRFMLCSGALLLIGLFVLTFSAQAQQEITDLTNQLTTTNTSMRGMYVSIRNIIFVVCGVVGLVVLPGKYQKMQSGDPDAGKSMVQWGGAIIFVATGAYLLQLLYFGA